MWLAPGNHWKSSPGPGTIVGGKGKKWGETAKIGKLSKLASLAKSFFLPFYPTKDA